MLRLLIAFSDPSLHLDVLLETTSVSDPLLVELVSTTRAALFMHDDCEADFACLWAPTAIRISDIIVAVTPVERAIVDVEQLRYGEGGLIELRIDGERQLRRIETALRDWPVVMTVMPDLSSSPE